MPQKTGKYNQAFREQKLEEIQVLLRKENYVLKSTQYVNNRTKLHLQCPQGHDWWATWDNIRQGKRCRQCYQEGIVKQVATRKSATQRKPREQHRQEMYTWFKSALEMEGYEIQTDQYLNNRTKVPVICSRGHQWNTTWNQFQAGKRCRQCWIEKSRLSQEEVEKELESQGCKLLSEYKGMEVKMKYQCSCGRVSYIRLPDFRKGVNCQACGGDKRRETLRRKRLSQLMNLRM